MNTAGVTFAGSIPALYEQHLGPLFFQPYAEDMAARLRDVTQGRILETAAGTGIVTRAMVRVLPTNVEIVATDLNQAMLDLAATKLQASNVTWRQGDAEALPFEDASFAVVVCQFGAMFFPDKVKAYREAHRVLKPEGRFLFSVWGRLDANPVSQIVHDSIGAIFPDDPPRFIERMPFGYWDADRIRRELQEAGFSRVDVEAVEKVTEATSPRQPAMGLCQGSPLRNEIEARAPDRLEEATDRVTEAIAARFGSSAVENRMMALVVTAWR